MALWNSDFHHSNKEPSEKRPAKMAGPNLIEV